MEGNLPTVGIVIPAYNEEANLHRVLDVVCATTWPAQIVVVDDGSADATSTVAAGYAALDPRVHALCLPQNQGKAGAMLAGVEMLTTDLVTFLDADLLNLRPDCISDLCAPVLADECEMAVALFQHGGLRTDGSHKLTPILSGQRCLHRQDALTVLAGLAGTGYGVETGLTLHAKRVGWRIRYVIWQHVSHVMKEQKRGWIAGLRCRWQMYVQIGAVVLAALGMLWGVRTLFSGTGNVRRFFHTHRRLQPVFTAAMVMLMILSWFFNPMQLRAYTNLRMQDLSTWQPDKYERVLVVAPHPDDEMLAAGGFILSALSTENPPEIRVVVVTNGDASYSSILLNGKNPISRLAYRQLAAVRQAESRAGMQSLGLPPENVSFLGFPDRGMSALWQKNWSNDKPYRSPTTGLTGVTQPDGSEAIYTGEEFLGLVRQTLRDFQPDAVIIPHPRDAHADHQAIAQFFNLAIALNEAEAMGSAPNIFAYLMWLRGNPSPQGIRLDQETLRLPNKYVEGSGEWLRFPLVEEIRQRKQVAANYYQSQKRQLGTMLVNNARGGNELFTEVVQHTLPRLSDVGADPQPGQWLRLPYENIWRAVNLTLPNAQPVALWSASDDDTLYLAVQVGKRSGNPNYFRFVVRTIDQQGSAEVRVSANQFVQTADGMFWVAALPLSDLYTTGSAHVAVVTLEKVVSQRVVAQSAWQILYLPGDPSR